MKKLLSIIAALSLPLAATAAVNVEWANAEDYRDPWATSMETAKSRLTTLNALQRHINERAERALKDGQTLTIRVTDLDLAGRYEPAYGPELDDVRIVRGADFARISFDYKLTGEDGDVIKEGEESLTHSLLVPLSLRNRNESAPYIRDLLDDWIAKEID